MRFHAKWCACTLVLAGFSILGAPSLHAQEADHAVSPQDLRQDLQKAAAARQANEAAVRQLLSTPAAQKAMKSMNVDYKKVEQAVGQLSDQDLANMAARSRQIQNDFAAGDLTNRDLLIIMLFIVALILIIVAVR
jgi:pyruvate/2-oxoglutarate dehydrogenase complex dihydrolipoamide acyltransferase (E2) component